MDIFLIYGAPCSGKTTWANERAGENDLIVDLDSIKSALCKTNPHKEGYPFLDPVLEIRGVLLSWLESHKRDEGRAFVIGGFPKRAQRMKIAIDLGASLIYCDTSEEECLKRAETCRPAGYDEVVRQWFEDYEPALYTDELYRDKEATAFYKSAAWKRKREEVLRMDHYECQVCRAQGKYTKATTVHHVHHLKDFPQYALEIFVDDERNLLSVCDACHNSLHPEKLSKTKIEKVQADTGEWW